MKRTFILAWAALMLTGNCLVLETATAAQKKKGQTIQQPTTHVLQDSARESAPLTYKTKLGSGKGAQVAITMTSRDVQIVGHNGDEVIIESRDYVAPPKRAEGLKPLYNQVEDNTKLGLSVTKTNNTLSIKNASRTSANYVIRVPKNASVVYKETTWQGGNLSIADLTGEIELKMNNSDVALNNVSGPVVANNTNGSIQIVFSSLNQNKPSAISTVNGEIDVTLPASNKANLKLKSMQGEIYTDFNMEVKREKEKDEEGLELIGGGGNIDGKINGGGVEISVQSISSDIFIRKKK